MNIPLQVRLAHKVQNESTGYVSSRRKTSRDAPLEFFFQEQSYSSLHSGRSLAWDHIRGVIDDHCGTIADFCGVIADPCGVVAIPEAIGAADHCATC